MPRKRSKKPRPELEGEPTKPGPEAERLEIPPEKLEPTLDRLLGKGQPPSDRPKRQRRPKK